jgi:DNA-binding NarL/FixJ family response regulator
VTGAEVDLLAGLRSGDWLNEETFDPLHYVVPGLLPEGLTILAGAPKIGKSWLALGLALAAAEGGKALGAIDVLPRPVLYLALEDGHRRMQDRCRALMGGRAVPSRFHYLLSVEPGYALPTIEEWVERYAADAPPFVVIDTLGRVKPSAQVGESAYLHDYKVGSRTKQIADARPGMSLTLLHHDRKADSPDFVERLSGTNGLAGAADTIIVLDRQRDTTSGTLSVTGRDVEEHVYALQLTTGGQWALDGSDLAAASERASTIRVSDGLDERSRSIIAVVTKGGEVTPKQVAEDLNLNANDVGTYLRRLTKAGRISKVDRGRYAPVVTPSEPSERVKAAPPHTPPPSVVSDPFRRSDGSDAPTDDAPPHTDREYFESLEEPSL